MSRKFVSGIDVLGGLAVLNTANANTVTLQAGVTSASYALTLPTAAPGSTAFLKSSAAGVMSWDTSTYMTSISAGSVTLAMMANLAASSIIGNNTGSPATPLALTGTQVTAMLDTFTTNATTKGLVPGSNSLGVTYFLRADGSWAVPVGTIGGSIASTQVAYGSGTNTIQGSASFTFDGTVLTAPFTTLPAGTTAHASLNIAAGVDPTAPSTGDVWNTSLGLMYRRSGYTTQLDSDMPAGAMSAPVITITGSGATIDVASLNVMLYPSTGYQNGTRTYTLAAQTGLALTDNSVNFLIANYNAGSPVMQVSTNPAIFNGSTIVGLAALYRIGSRVHVIPVDWGMATASRTNERSVNLERYRRWNGLMLSASGLNFTVTSGNIYYGCTLFSLAQAISTDNTTNVERWVHTAGVWGSTDVSVYDNAYYDNGTDAVALSAGFPTRYAVNWVYRYIDGAGIPKLAIILGNGNYSQAQAIAATIPTSVPPVLTYQSILVGRIIVARASSTAYQVDSAFTQVFASSSVIDHNSTGNLQGGTTNEYYHLTNAQNTTLTGWTGSQTANYVLAAPNGSAGAPSFRALVGADVPLTSAQVAFGSGTGTLTSSTGITWTDSTKTLKLGVASTSTGILDLACSGSANLVSLTTAATSAAYTLTLPAAQAVTGSRGQVLTSIGAAQMVWQDHQFNQGFDIESGSRNANSTVSFDPSTGIFSLTAVGGGTPIRIWKNGVCYDIGTKTVTIPNTGGTPTTPGAYYITFDGTNLVAAQGVWDIYTDVPVATIYYYSATLYAINDERHNASRNRAWHYWSHTTIGARYASGLTGTFTNTTLSMLVGVLEDEDIIFSTGGTKTTCRLWRYDGTRMVPTAGSTTTPYLVDAGTLQYDNGTGTPANVSNNNYVINDVWGTTDPVAPIWIRVGTAQYATAGAATAALGTTSTWQNLPTAEMKLLYQVIYRNQGGTPTFISATDYRTAGNLPGGTGALAYVSGAGTVGTIPKWTTGGTALTDSIMRDTGTALIVDPAGLGTLPALPTGTALKVVSGSGNANVSRIMVDTFTGTGLGNAAFAGRSARGTNAAPTAIGSGDEMTHLSAWGYGKTGYSSAPRGYISIFAAENWDPVTQDTAQGTRIGFFTTAPTTITTTEKVRIWGDGGVQIGGTFTASAGAATLSTGGLGAGYATSAVTTGIGVGVTYFTFTGSTASQTITLPAANTYGTARTPLLVVRNKATVTVTLARAGADTIDGATSIILAPGDSVILLSDGSSLWDTNGGAVSNNYPLNDKVTVLADANPVVVDAAYGNNFIVTLTGTGHVIGIPANPRNGAKILIKVAQGAGGYAYTFNSIYQFTATNPFPTTSTAAGAVDVFGFEYNTTANKWWCIGFDVGHS